MQRAGLDTLAADGDGLVIGAGVTLATLAASELLAPYAAARDGRLARRLAAAAQRRHRRRQPLPGHALLVLPRRGVALLARRRRHLLRADRRPPQAQPAFPATASRRTPPTWRRRSRRSARASSCARRAGERELELLELYRIPTQERRSLLTLEPGEIVARCACPRRRDASAFRRLGERQAFSFPLVERRRRAPRRRGRSGRRRRREHPRARSTRRTRSRELPGNPQTMWKRTVLRRSCGRGRSTRSAP